MGTHWNSIFRCDNMKVLIVLPAIFASIACDADADALYGGYGYRNIGPSALGYPYAYAPGNALSYNAPLRAAAPIPVARSYAVAAKPAVRASAPLVKAAASAATSQFHAQDELGNFSYGYDNPNSASSVSGNSEVVTGTFVNKAQGTATNFVSDAFGYRQI